MSRNCSLLVSSYNAEEHKSGRAANSGGITGDYSQVTDIHKREWLGDLLSKLRLNLGETIP